MKLKLIATIAVLAVLPLVAQAQPKPAVAKVSKAEVQRIMQSIVADKAKSQKYCDLLKINDQMDQADQKKDTKKVEALEKQAEALMTAIGPDYAKLMEGLQGINPDSPEGKEIGAVIEAVDKQCK